MWWWWLEKTESVFEGFNITELDTDEAWLNIFSTYKKPLWLYVLSEDCYTCSYQKFLNEPILQNHSYNTTVNTQHGITFRFRTSGEFNYTPSSDDSFAVCSVQGNLGEFGVYKLSVHNDGERLANCSLISGLEPVNIYMPIVVTLVFWLALGFVLKCFLNHRKLLANSLKRIYRETLTFLTTNHHKGNETLIAATDRVAQELETDTKDATQEFSNQKKTEKRKKKVVPKLDKPVEPVVVRNENKSEEQPSSSASVVRDQNSQATRTIQNERLKSLDAFRGICILIMIFADDGGGGYYFFRHCTWNGIYVADLAFPWFLWICGVSIPFSLYSKLTSGTSKIAVFKELVIRSIKLIFLGIMVNTSTRATPVQLEDLRIPGVLQRFGLCYLIGSTLLAIFYDTGHRNFSSTDSGPEEQARLSIKHYFKDLGPTKYPWIIVLICVGIHTAIIFLLPVPNCPKGYLGPAGLHNDSSLPPECVGGAAGYIDRLIFGMKHIYNRPTSKKVYGSGAFDPEGTLGVLTSVLHIWLGVQTGITVLTYKSAQSRVIRLLSWSALCGFGGFILCGGISNSGWIPVNKNLWSLSFVLITSSAALILLAMLYLVIDVQQKWKGSPLVETGRNSILLYLGHEVCHAMLPWNFSYGRMVLHTSKLMETSWGIVLWILIAVYLHSQKIFFVV